MHMAWMFGCFFPPFSSPRIFILHLQMGERGLTQTLLETTDAPGQLDVLREEGDALGMDGAKVGVFHQVHEKSFSSLGKKEKRKRAKWQRLEGNPPLPPHPTR